MLILSSQIAKIASGQQKFFMDRHREIFNQLLTASGYSAKEVSSWTGINESRLSRFRTGKLDLEVGEFFRLLDSFPKDFQECFWLRFRQVDGSWRSLILSADPADIEEILKLLAERWAIIQNHESASRSPVTLAS